MGKTAQVNLSGWKKSSHNDDGSWNKEFSIRWYLWFYYEFWRIAQLTVLTNTFYNNQIKVELTGTYWVYRQTNRTTAMTIYIGSRLFGNVVPSWPVVHYMALLIRYSTCTSLLVALLIREASIRLQYPYLDWLCKLSGVIFPSCVLSLHSDGGFLYYAESF